MGNRNEELAALVRQAVSTAGALRLLVERMNDVGWRMNDYSDEDLLTVASALYSDEDLLTAASALRGSAMMMAMDTGNVELLSEITGRKVYETDPTEWLRKLRGDEGQP
ncbi:MULTISPECIES: hypothetical protein [unclassified Streptomyces]|uniref:hypothetical protein n=1 Tax=unclassified Streptomyces TaxID=2593676 RepID=UPI001BE88BE3|nr:MULTISPECIES: hypothetical protein [unclassified Streptomyces]MBT2405597.1 hypothetical protein [Streptomyces sp. ISL-21]MBT2607723.1 hypothetical protein [Streptomyces sp. ISL-87]